MTLQPMHPSGPGQPLMSIGNLHFTEHYVMTPAGTWPLAQTNVTTSDQTATTTHTPAWAVVLTIMFIWFFLLSLLFLLARQTRVSGYMAVHVQSGGYSSTYRTSARVLSDTEGRRVQPGTLCPEPDRTRTRFLPGAKG